MPRDEQDTNRRSRLRQPHGPARSERFFWVPAGPLVDVRMRPYQSTGPERDKMAAPKDAA